MRHDATARFIRGQTRRAVCSFLCASLGAIKPPEEVTERFPLPCVRQLSLSSPSVIVCVRLLTGRPSKLSAYGSVPTIWCALVAACDRSAGPWDGEAVLARSTCTTTSNIDVKWVLVFTRRVVGFSPFLSTVTAPTSSVTLSKLVKSVFKFTSLFHCLLKVHLTDIQRNLHIQSSMTSKILFSLLQQSACASRMDQL